jgi:hypothetical protein
LHREIAKVMAQPEVRQRMATLGLEPVVNTPDEFADWIKVETAQWPRSCGLLISKFNKWLMGRRSFLHSCHLEALRRSGTRATAVA